MSGYSVVQDSGTGRVVTTVDPGERAVTVDRWRSPVWHTFTTGRPLVARPAHDSGPWGPSDLRNGAERALEALRGAVR